MARSAKNVLAVNGAKLTEARINAGLRGQDVADFLATRGIGCNKSAVCRWEQGKTSPTDEQIRAMAELLKTSSFITGRVK